MRGSNPEYSYILGSAILGLGLDSNSAYEPEWNDVYYFYRRRMCLKLLFEVPPLVRRCAPKVLDAKTPSDNALFIKSGASSEARVLACPGLSAQTSVMKKVFI